MTGWLLTSSLLFASPQPSPTGYESGPYEASELAEARAKLDSRTACGPSDLAKIPPSAPARGHVIRKRDLLDLFDTDSDLSGFDVDVSLYVRDADDTDVRLFWRPVDGRVPAEGAGRPVREELCPAPIGGAKALVKRAQGRAWRWDALAGEWSPVGESDVLPGRTIWVDSAVGGYSPDVGFDLQGKEPVDKVVVSDDAPELNSQGSDPETRTPKALVTLTDHTAHVRAWADKLATALQLDSETRSLLKEIALWHDVGKAHDVFKARCGLAPEDEPLAKTPDMNWLTKGERNRRSFRHELASALAYLAYRDWKDDASLAAYLIAAHHGKMRMRLRALPKESPAPDGKLFARGIWDGDPLPPLELNGHIIPETSLDLDIMQLGEGDHGPSWSARTQQLLKAHGPFRLAWLEALVRIADWRASEAEESAAKEQQKDMRHAAS